MKIIHKNSREVIDIFPSYGKYHFGIYGVLVLTTNKKVSFIYCSDNMTFFDDVTDEYEIIEEPITYTEEEMLDFVEWVFEDHMPYTYKDDEKIWFDHVNIKYRTTNTLLKMWLNNKKK